MKQKTAGWIAVLVSTVGFAAMVPMLTAASQESGGAAPFLVKPYLQLGDAPRLSPKETMRVLWHVAPGDSASWTLEARQRSGGWKPQPPPTKRTVLVQGQPHHVVYSAQVRDLQPGQPFPYRLKRGGSEVFQSVGKTRKAANQPFRAVIFGDCAQNSPGQFKVAYQTARAQPDFVFLTGDIVYADGTISQYRQKYWPVYNSDTSGPTKGAPLIRSTPFLAAPGNHDVGHSNLGKYPDGMAYFLHWEQPLNGPNPGVSQADLGGNSTNIAAFKKSAGARFPRMANFSFDYGCTHWTVLDANKYTNWNDPALRAWLEADLAGAENAAWRIVAFHQPGFQSSVKHFREQQMRVIAPILEKHKVAIVFNGHVHNYQRSYPLRFQPAPGAKASGEVAGKFTLDKTYDGKTNTKPRGVLYIVTGAGGAGLYNISQQTQPETWQPFTHKYVANLHSLTVLDATPAKLSLRQVDENGAEVDRFVLTR